MENNNYDYNKKKWGDSGLENQIIQESPNSHTGGIKAGELLVIVCIALCVPLFIVIFFGVTTWKVSQSIDVGRTAVILGNEEYLNEIYSSEVSGELKLTLVQKSTSEFTLVEGFFKRNRYSFSEAVMVNESGERYILTFNNENYYENMRLDNSISLNIYEKIISEDKKELYGVDEDNLINFYITK